MPLWDPYNNYQHYNRPLDFPSPINVALGREITGIPLQESAQKARGGYKGISAYSVRYDDIPTAQTLMRPQMQTYADQIRQQNMNIVRVTQ